jgi:hypothetical protein
MIFWWLQIKGLCATGLVAGFGVIVMLAGFEYHPQWRDRIGWLVLGGILLVPFIAVLVSVVVSRCG